MKFDKVIFFCTLLILIIGLFVLFSASFKYFSHRIILRQIMWMLVGLLFLFITMKIDYNKFISASYFLYGLTLFFLILVLFIGKTRGGAHRWISLGVFNFQPSEMAKITLILALASFMGKRKNETKRLGFLMGVFAIVLPVVFLVLIEPDLGTAFLFIPVMFAMLFIAGASIKHLLGIVGLGFLSFPVFWHFLRDYQKQRLFVFINPNIDPLGSGYTVIQSKIAVGSGGLLGKGWLGGTQNQLNFLPERHTDFIFSVIGEEWGFFGALIFILLYFLILYRSLKIMESTPDINGRLVASGFITMISLQIIINIGMTTGFLPIVGLTLPFVSYGGSSLITMFISIGFLLNIGRQRPLF